MLLNGLGTNGYKVVKTIFEVTITITFISTCGVQIHDGGLYLGVVVFCFASGSNNTLDYVYDGFVKESGLTILKTVTNR